MPRNNHFNFSLCPVYPTTYKLYSLQASAGLPIRWASGFGDFSESSPPLTILGSIFPSHLLRWALGNNVSFFDGLWFILKHAIIELYV